MGEQAGSALAKLEGYAATGQYIVLQPVVRISEEDALSPFFVADVSIQRFNPDPKGPHFYVAWWDSRKLAFRKLGLFVLGSQAGLKWGKPDIQGPYTRPDGHRQVIVTATAAVRQQSGELYWISQSKEIDTAVIEEKKIQEERDKGKLTEAQILDKVRRQILQIKTDLLPLAESKAMTRTVRSVLGVPQDYWPNEAAMPFVIPSLHLRPDMSNPLELERVLLEGHRAAEELYGPSALPSPTTQSGTEATGPSAATAEPPPHDASEKAAAATASRADEEAPPSKPGGEVAAARSEQSAPDAEREAVKPHPYVSKDGTDRFPCVECTFFAPHPAHQGFPKPEQKPPQADVPEPPPMPKVNPKLDAGPFAGKAYSEIIESPQGEAYLQAIAQEGKTVGQRKVAEQWVAWKAERDRPRLA